MRAASVTRSKRACTKLRREELHRVHIPETFGWPIRRGRETRAEHLPGHASEEEAKPIRPAFVIKGGEADHDGRSSGDVQLPRHVDGPARAVPSPRRLVALRD